MGQNDTNEDFKQLAEYAERQGYEVEICSKYIIASKHNVAIYTDTDTIRKLCETDE